MKELKEFFTAAAPPAQLSLPDVKQKRALMGVRKRVLLDWRLNLVPRLVKCSATKPLLLAQNPSFYDFGTFST